MSGRKHDCLLRVVLCQENAGTKAVTGQHSLWMTSRDQQVSNTAVAAETTVVDEDDSNRLRFRLEENSNILVCTTYVFHMVVCGYVQSAKLWWLQGELELLLFVNRPRQDFRRTRILKFCFHVECQRKFLFKLACTVGLQDTFPSLSFFLPT